MVVVDRVVPAVSFIAVSKYPLDKLCLCCWSIAGVSPAHRGYTYKAVCEWLLAFNPMLRLRREVSSRKTYLVTVAPREVAVADVLVGILDTLLEGRHVRPVLPMLVPEVVGVEAGEEEGGGDAAV